MDIFDFDKLANEGAPVPRGLGFHEQCYYLGLRHMYATFHAGALTARQGVQEKAELRGAYERVTAAEKRRTEAYRALQEKIVAAEQIKADALLGSGSDKSGDTRELARMLARYIADSTGDPEFYGAVVRRWGLDA